MNYRKAVGAGLLVFAVQFALVNVLGNIVGPFLAKGGAWAGYAWQAAMVAFLIGIVYFVSQWYFTGNKISLINGVYLGAILVITNVSITLAQAIPAIILGRDVTQAVISYLTSIPFWITVSITIVSAVGTAYWRHRTTACNVKEAIGSCMPKVDGCTDCAGDTCSAHQE